MGLCPKPRLEPSFGEGSKNSKNFTAKGNRMAGRKEFLRAANPVALCGEVSGSSSPPEGGSTLDSKQSPKVFPPFSLPVQHFEDEVAQGGVEDVVGVVAAGDLRAEVERGAGLAVDHREGSLSAVPAELTDR